MPHPIEAFKLPDGRWDMLGYERSIGRTVYADHCVRCGRWARVVAGDNSARDSMPGRPIPPNPWYRTNCRRCGVTQTERVWTPGKGWISYERSVE